MIAINTVFRIILSLGVAILLTGLSVIAIYLVFRWLRVKADREHTIRLVNQGNCRCQYHLWVECPQPELTFKFLSNQIPLSQVKEKQEDSKVEAAIAELPQTKNRELVENQPALVHSAAPLKKAQAVAAKGGAAAGLLGTLGSILPGKLGASLKAKAEIARNVQSDTAKAVRAPQSAQRQIDALKKSGEKMGVHAEASDHQVEKAALSEAKFSPSMRIHEMASDKKEAKVFSGGTIKVETVGVCPGETLLLNLKIGTARRRYPAGSFSYTIHSQQIPLDDHFGSASPVKKTGLVTFPPIATLRYWLPALSSMILVLFTLSGSFVLILLIWGKI